MFRCLCGLTANSWIKVQLMSVIARHPVLAERARPTATLGAGQLQPAAVIPSPVTGRALARTLTVVADPLTRTVVVRVQGAAAVVQRLNHRGSPPAAERPRWPASPRRYSSTRTGRSG